MTVQERLQFAQQLTDAQAEGLTAYGEARNQRPKGMVAVIATIQNRARFKKTRTSVQAFRTAAYSCWLDDGSDNNMALTGLAHLVLAGEPTPYNLELRVCLWLASQIDLVDPTGGATHYFNPKVVEAPPWTKTDATHHPVKLVTIDDHEFWGHVAF